MISSSWDSKFKRWSSRPSETEQTKSDNAIRAVRSALYASTALSERKTKVFVQGSYRNRVNVRQDSDVDVGVVCYDSFFPDYPEGMGRTDFGNVKSEYPFSRFKSDLESALVAHFGRPSVERGNKSLKIKENSYRVDADVVPLFEYRRYWTGGGYRAGVALQPDTGSRITNYPERLLDHWPSTPLHYENAVAKNTATSRAFKGIVRILKCLSNEMASEGFASADEIPGYLSECLVYNCPNTCFITPNWRGDVERVLNHIWNATSTDASCTNWTEVDEIKYLFRSSQPWNRAQVQAFIGDARIYLGVA